jgi:PAS domain S-box-containing protein
MPVNPDNSKVTEKLIKTAIVHKSLIGIRKKYDALFNQSINGLAYCKIVFDDNNQPIDYVFLEVNAAFEKQTGLKKENVVGKHATQIIPNIKNSAFDFINIYSKVALTGEPVETYQEDLKRWHAVYVVSPKKTFFLSLFTDITKRKQAEETLAYHADLLSKVHEALVGIDSNYIITYWNKAAEEIFGWTKEEALGKNSEELLQTKIEGSSSVEGIAKLLAEGHYEGEVQYLRKDGEYFFADVNAVTIKDANGKLQGIMTVARDITERKHMEAKLEGYSKHLEDLVEDRTKQLRDAERLAAIGQTAAMVGHDIRNPLQAIAGDLYLLDCDIASLPKDRPKKSLLESVKNIQDNLMYIAKIIEDLQDYSRVIQPCIEKISFEKVIAEVMLIVPIADNLQVVIDVAKGFPEFTSDYSMLKRALSNLVHNAVQAMPKGGKLTISAYKKNGNVFFSVEDTGVGIPEEIKPKLFQPMVTTKSRGQGLGLAVVKRLVEALNGKISFESQEGKGTTFIVRLPPSPKKIDSKWMFK